LNGLQLHFLSRLGKLLTNEGLGFWDLGFREGSKEQARLMLSILNLRFLPFPSTDSGQAAQAIICVWNLHPMNKATRNKQQDASTPLSMT
jgi:hypothetical protein